MAKYNLLAYLLWLVLGPMGIHHFYLGRDHQGVLWLTSFGGLFGVGWVRDFTRIPAYVKEANCEPDFMLDLGRLIRRRKRPSICANLSRVVGQVAFGWFYRLLVLWAVPEEYADNSAVVLLVAPLGSAFGTYMVSNAGVVRCHWRYSVLGAYLGELLFGHTHLLLDAAVPSLAVSVGMLFSTFGWEFDRRPRTGQGTVVFSGGGGRGGCLRCCRHTCCKRAGIWTFIFTIYCLLLFSAVYFNASIPTAEGESVKVREAVNNFFKSAYWSRLKTSFWLFAEELWDEYKSNGWEGAWDKMRVMADLQGEERARVILGVKANATLSEVKSRYHQLAKDWHPDRHQGASTEMKERVQNKFLEIKEAYEILQKIYKQRESRGFGSYKERG